jgi:twinkle protein
MKTWADFKIDIPPDTTGQIYTTCPKCSHKRKKPNVKCLSINADEGVWNCHHCPWSGTLKDGDRWIKDDFYLQDDYLLPAVKLNKPTKAVLKWFADRGIDADEVEAGGIGTYKVYMPQVEKFVSAIAFPFTRDGELINVKYRDAEKNMRMEKGAERILYGMDDCIGFKTLYWVEGEPDKHALGMAGIRNCVSVPDGAPDPKSKNYLSKFSFIEGCSDFIKQFDKHVLALDNDQAGQVLEQELARRLGTAKCSRVTWPEGCKDANEVLIKHGKDRLQKEIGNAKPYPVAGIYAVADITDKIQNLYHRGFDRGQKTGLPNLDFFYRVRPGEWTVVTGTPSSGKSEFVDAIMVHLSRKFGWRHGVFSPENQPLERHFVKLAEKYIKKPFTPGYYQDAGENRMTTDDLKAAIDWVGEHFFFILPDEDQDDNPTLTNILDKGKILVFREGIKILSIDPWNELEHSRPSGKSEAEYISESLTKIRKFARTNICHTFVVAHPTKLQKIWDKVSRTFITPEPSLYDISGAAHWRNKCDYGIVVHRADLNEDKVKVSVKKVRFKEVGHIGHCYMAYDKETGLFLPPEATKPKPEPEPTPATEEEIFDEKEPGSDGAELDAESKKKLEELAEEAADLFS